MNEHKILNSDNIHVNSLIAMMKNTPNDKDFGRKARAYLMNVNRHEQSELRNSHEWIKEYGYRIIDFDGWNRDDFQFSYFEEKINRQEFERRLFLSTITKKTKC